MPSASARWCSHLMHRTALHWRILHTLVVRQMLLMWHAGHGRVGVVHRHRRLLVRHALRRLLLRRLRQLLDKGLHKLGVVPERLQHLRFH